MEMNLMKMDVMKKKKRKGFTLIELIVVIAIIGILAAIMIPKFSGFQDKARRTQVVSDSKQIQTAIDTKLAESASGTITEAATLAADTALGAGKSVVLISGVDSTRITTLVYGANGTFKMTESINSVEYSAERKITNGVLSATVVTP